MRAARAWDTVVRDAAAHGVRNSQAVVIAPTGTIGLAMDCDTTGIEPDLALVKTKKLVGGGTMSIVNQTIPRALRRLGYSSEQVDDIVDYIDEHMSVIGAPHLSAAHLPVFACSMGDNTIHYEGHIRMMAAVQPFVSGGISKTANMPEDVTVEDVEALHMLAWELGLKSVAIYRDNCKLGQPLSTSKPVVGADSTGQVEIVERIVHHPVRQKMARTRRGRTFEFRVADCKGFATIGEYDNGQPGEIFLTVSKQGSTMAGVMDAFAKSVSYGLQYGVPLRAFVEAFTNMRFEPAGMTDDPDIRFASSIMDYLFRRSGDRVHDLRRTSRTRHLLRRRTAAADTAGTRRAGDADPPGIRPRPRPEVGVRGRRRRSCRSRVADRAWCARVTRRCACSAAS